MEKLKDILDFWYIKALAAFLLTLFAPVQLSCIILILMILIDLATGVAQAIKVRRFSSRYLRKTVNKIILYGICIITTRLLEQGILYFYETYVISQMVMAFLIITEAVSILENLTLLGAPIPTGLINNILKNVKIFGLEGAVRQTIDEYAEIKQIEEMMDYQIPTLKNGSMRTMLNIKFKVWADAVLLAKKSIIEKQVSNDVLYYRIISLIEMSRREIRDKWNEQSIPKECMEEFEEWHNPRVDQFMQSIKNVCYSDRDMHSKKQELIDRIIVLLYQTILDAHKSEAILCQPCGCDVEIK